MLIFINFLHATLLIITISSTTEDQEKEYFYYDYDDYNPDEKKCDLLYPPANGYFVHGFCSNKRYTLCGIRCFSGYTLVEGSSLRECDYLSENSTNLTWSGSEGRCKINRCENLTFNQNVVSNCSSRHNNYGTFCEFNCTDRFLNIGSKTRYCTSIKIWTGVEAKCRKLDDDEYISTDVTPTPISTTTVSFNENYQDLSPLTIFFGFSFRKISLNANIFNLPSSFEFWFRTNYTNDIQIAKYNYICFNASIVTNENSSLHILFMISGDYSKNYYFSLNVTLVRNQWTKILIQQTNHELRVYVNAAIRFASKTYNSLYRSQIDCDYNYNHIVKRFNGNTVNNKFEIKDFDNTTSVYDPMRGEITWVFLYDLILNESDVVYTFYKCDYRLKTKTKLLFDWSRVLIDRNLDSFKKRLAFFCRRCKEPMVIRYALVSYDGLRNGDELTYTCLSGYELVGEPTSNCMIYGEWHPKTPRCKRDLKYVLTTITTSQKPIASKKINDNHLKSNDDDENDYENQDTWSINVIKRKN